MRNTPGLAWFLTLTYSGEPPREGRTAKVHLAKLRRWLVDQGVGLVWKLEFCKSGRPHFHLFTNAPVDEDALRSRWARAAGCPETPNLVQSGPVLRQEAAEYYAQKRKGGPSDVAPVGFADAGRRWGHAGPEAVPVTLVRFEGEARAVAKVARALKAVLRARHRAQGKGTRTRWTADDGQRGRWFYGAGGKTLADDLARYARTLEGVEILGLDAERGATVRAVALKACTDTPIAPQNNPSRVRPAQRYNDLKRPGPKPGTTTIQKIDRLASGPKGSPKDHPGALRRERVFGSGP